MSKIRWFLFGLEVYEYPTLITELISKLSTGSEEVLLLFPSNGIHDAPRQITRLITGFRDENLGITVHVIPFIESEESAELNAALQVKESVDQGTVLERIQSSKADISVNWSDINNGRIIECLIEKLFFYYQKSDIRILLPNTVAHSQSEWRVCSDKVWKWLDEKPNCLNKGGLLFSEYPPEQCVVPWETLYEKLDEKGYGLWVLAQSCSQGSNDPVQRLYTNKKSNESLWAINSTGDRSCITGCYTMGKNGKGNWIVDAFILNDSMQWSRYSGMNSGRQSRKELDFPRFLGSRSHLGIICAKEMESILQRIIFSEPEDDAEGNPGIDRVYFSYFDSPFDSMIERNSVVNWLRYMLQSYGSEIKKLTVRLLNDALGADLRNHSQKFDGKYLVILADNDQLQVKSFMSTLDMCETMVRHAKIMTRFVIVRSSSEEPPSLEGSRQIDAPLYGTMELSIACRDEAVKRSIAGHIESYSFKNTPIMNYSAEVDTNHSGSREQEDTHEKTVQYTDSNTPKHQVEEIGTEKFLNQEERNER